MSDDSIPWYKDGLRFSCTGCGKCCTGAPGAVWISEDEIKEMADYLNISIENFKSVYTRKIGDRLSLKENSRNFDCVFLKGKSCTIYSVRPKQCRTFPFWKDSLSSEKDWKETAERCEGIDHAEAPLISLLQIESLLD